MKRTGMKAGRKGMKAKRNGHMVGKVRRARRTTKRERMIYIEDSVICAFSEKNEPVRAREVNRVLESYVKVTHESSGDNFEIGFRDRQLIMDNLKRRQSAIRII